VRVLATLLCLCCASAALAAGSTQRSDGHPPRTFAKTIYWNDVYFDVDGDIQAQLDPGNCNDTGSGCTIKDYNQVNVGGGFTPSALTCSSMFECIDPVSHVDRCASSIYCNGANWKESGLTRLDAQVRTHLGLHPKSPIRAAFVIQVGDEINAGNYCAGVSRADNCASAATLVDACGATTALAAKQEIIDQFTNMIARYAQPMLSARMPTLIANGNHGNLGCYETMLKPLLVAQPFFVNSAADVVHTDTATLYSLRVQTALGPICLLSVPYAVYSSTQQVATPLVGCGGTIPTITVSHWGERQMVNFYFDLKGQPTQIVDRTGHPEVFATIRGHTVGTGLIWNPILSTDTNSGAAIYDVRSNWQWSPYRGLNNSTFGGAPYDGISAFDGTGGETVRCRISPTRQTFECKPFNPIAGKYGAWDYASTGYGGIDGFSGALDWCTRFGC
jgi:hypothetical protein